MELAEVVHTLSEGARIVGEVLEPHGFIWTSDKPHAGHPGNSASGNFTKADRKLALHFRWSLGLVSYHVGSAVVSHEALMRYLGHHQDARYPGFSTNPLDAFRHLASDLEKFGGDFIAGGGATVASASKATISSGFSALSDV
jgi:hypothetical protein